MVGSLCQELAFKPRKYCPRYIRTEYTITKDKKRVVEAAHLVSHVLHYCLVKSFVPMKILAIRFLSALTQVKYFEGASHYASTKSIICSIVFETHS